VIGSGGAGKSTFALALGARTGLPVVHLDREYWRPGWVEPPKEAWEARVRDLIARPRWIHDGNYGGTLDARLAAADTCVFLDLPRTTCLARVVRRRIALGGRTRPDVTEGCPERLTWDFVRWIWTYPRRRRPGILTKVADFERRGGRAVVPRSAADVRAFLDGAVATSVRPA